MGRGRVARLETGVGNLLQLLKALNKALTVLLVVLLLRLFRVLSKVFFLAHFGFVCPAEKGLEFVKFMKKLLLLLILVAILDRRVLRTDFCLMGVKPSLGPAFNGMALGKSVGTILKVARVIL